MIHASAAAAPPSLPRPELARVAIVTDAWEPQTNGVVTTLRSVRDQLLADGRDVRVVGPCEGRTIPCPRYAEIRLSLTPGRLVRRALDDFAPDAIHVATEGPLGLAARRWCRRRRLPFTTSYHTQFPLYLRQYAGVPLALSYAHLRRFHGSAARTLVPTRSMATELESRGFRNLRVWTRGVDTGLFGAVAPHDYGVEGPVCLYCGRVATEKNIEAFLAADLPGTKVVVGDGPIRPALERRHPDVIFTGYQFGEALAAHYAGADVFVFPSRTDTFGVVIIEALASGLPVAAYPVTGPVDIVEPGVTGGLDEDLGAAVRAALACDPADCRRAASGYTWRRTAALFLEVLEPIRRVSPPTPSRAAAAR